MGIGKLLMGVVHGIWFLASCLAVTIVTTGCVFAVDDGLTHYRNTTATVTSKEELTQPWQGGTYTYGWLLDVATDSQKGKLTVDQEVYKKTQPGATVPVAAGRGPILGIFRIEPPLSKEGMHPAGRVG